MVQFTTRYQEAYQPDPFLSPALIWVAQEGYADWQMSGTDLLGGGDGADLNTAVIIQLFTNRRAEPGDPVDPSEDPQGWWGDAIDIAAGEDVLGSRLWLLRRSALTNQTAIDAVKYANEALQVLINQGLFTSFDVSAAIDRSQNLLTLSITGHGAASPYQQKFAILWPGG